jgi:hypothetical protein
MLACEHEHMKLKDLCDGILFVYLKYCTNIPCHITVISL